MSPRPARQERTNAIAAGVLYIAATAAGVASVLTGAPSEVVPMAGSKGAVLVSAGFDILMAVAVAGIALMLYPILARDAGTPAKQGLAIWYAATRITEGTLYFVGVIVFVTMLKVSETIADLPSEQAAAHEAASLQLQTLFDYSWIAGQTIFTIGAAMLYSLLYASNRVPRWLSVWGLISVPFFLIGGLTMPFTDDADSTISNILYAPMFLQEMVLAVWIIGWGFNPPATNQRDTR